MSKRDSVFNYSDGVTLKEFFLEKFEAANVALRLSTDALNKRLEHMNEFREALKDKDNLMITRNEYELAHKELQRQVDELRLSRANLEGKASANSVMVAIALAVVGIVISIIKLL
jgi:hypothetical protein